MKKIHILILILVILGFTEAFSLKKLIKKPFKLIGKIGKVIDKVTKIKKVVEIGLAVATVAGVRRLTDQDQDYYEGEDEIFEIDEYGEDRNDTKELYFLDDYESKFINLTKTISDFF